MTNDTKTSRANREPDSDLFLPRRPARNQQAGDIRAGDQQYAACQRHQHPQRSPQEVTEAPLPLAAGKHLDHVLQESRTDLGRRFVKRRLFLLHFEHAVEERLQRGLRLFARYAGFQPSEYLHPTRAAVMKLEFFVEQRH